MNEDGIKAIAFDPHFKQISGLRIWEELKAIALREGLPISRS